MGSRVIYKHRSYFAVICIHISAKRLNANRKKSYTILYIGFVCLLCVRVGTNVIYTLKNVVSRVAQRTLFWLSRASALALSHSENYYRCSNYNGSWARGRARILAGKENTMNLGTSRREYAILFSLCFLFTATPFFLLSYRSLFPFSESPLRIYIHPYTRK